VILSDGAIVDALAVGDVVVNPSVPAGSVRGLGIRLHLGATLLVPVPTDGEIDLAYPKECQFTKYTMDGQGYVLHAHDYVLASTAERVATSRSLACLIDGRSSIARQGLFVHCSSMVFDSVHEGARVVVLELFNCSRRSIRLRPGLPIAMLAFLRLERPILQAAAPQYADQQSTLPPRPMERADEGATDEPI